MNSISPENELALQEEMYDDEVFIAIGSACPICRVVSEFGHSDPTVRELMQECSENLHERGVAPAEEYRRLAEQYNRRVVEFLSLENGRVLHHMEDARLRPWSFPIVRRHFRKCPNTGAEIVRLRHQLDILYADLRRLNALLWQSDGERVSLDLTVERARERVMQTILRFSTAVDASTRASTHLVRAKKQEM